MPKHYAKTEPFTNDDLLNPRYRSCYAFKAAELAKDKASYRRRERRVLNRMLAAEVEVAEVCTTYDLRAMLADVSDELRQAEDRLAELYSVEWWTEPDDEHQTFANEDNQWFFENAAIRLLDEIDELRAECEEIRSATIYERSGR